MKKNGHRRDDVPELPYRPAPGAPPGVEVLDLPRLAARRRAQGADPYAPRRLGFHELIAVHAGTVRCAAGWSVHEVGPGSWFWVRPGQVHQYLGDLSAAEATVILFPTGFLDRVSGAAAGVDRRVRRAPLTPAGAQRTAVEQVLELLRGEYARLADLPLEAHIEVMRHLLSVLLLRLAHLRGGTAGESAGNEAFLRLQEAVERDFARTHKVADYAARLGYSVRTLTRAAHAVAGRGAKRLIDDRVLLEAKRLLVHTDLPASAVGDRVGFAHPTAFGAFFRRRTGMTPATFRAVTRGAAPDPAAGGWAAQEPPSTASASST
ncbi:AraC family transcriptional regulator [Actinomadura sp. ATCC 31491]|uniref:AraC family transcriptional regulator n=1 Tax=Actinomadura luzonensis TaxID=2805427 RepID=A0ABT0FTQ0_9ACTN|nr:AraC family transcriptional regulator [Actinomadura luzonensis]MCK2215710.1 AraC family transcriptional regulator [Actinomadura luzonensis]